MGSRSRCIWEPALLPWLDEHVGRAAAENHHKRNRHAVVPLQHRRDPDKEKCKRDSSGVLFQDRRTLNMDYKSK